MEKWAFFPQLKGIFSLFVFVVMLSSFSVSFFKGWTPGTGHCVAVLVPPTLDSEVKQRNYFEKRAFVLGFGVFLSLSLPETPQQSTRSCFSRPFCKFWFPVCIPLSHSYGHISLLLDPGWKPWEASCLVPFCRAQEIHPLTSTVHQQLLWVNALISHILWYKFLINTIKYPITCKVSPFTLFFSISKN